MSLPIFKLITSTLCLILSSLSLLAIQEAKPKEDPVITNPLISLEGSIHFDNGDSISGKILNWSKSNISVSSPDLLEPVTFSNSNILKITFNDNQTTNKANPHLDETILIMNNRDNEVGKNGMIRGSLVDITPQKIKLNTAYAGEISVMRKFISKMEIDPKKGYLYYGPKSLEHWHNNSLTKGWKFENNSLISSRTANGNIAKNINLPDQTSISFDLSWKKSPYISLFLYSSDHEMARPDNYYKLSLDRGRWLLNKYIDGRRVNTTRILKEKKLLLRKNAFGRPRITPLKSFNKLHAQYSIYIDKTKGLFHIYQNGSKLISFLDADPKTKKFGTAMHLLNNSRYPVRIKNLRISKWNGHIPNKINEKTFSSLKDAKQPKVEGEHILLKNGDFLFGKINKVDNGLVEIETKHAPLKLPLNRLRSIDITASIKKEEPIKDIDDIKCYYKDKGWVILKLIALGEKSFTAYHQAIGEKKFNYNAFKRIDLNIYDEEANSKRKPDTW